SRSPMARPTAELLIRPPSLAYRGDTERRPERSTCARSRPARSKPASAAENCPLRRSGRRGRGPRRRRGRVRWVTASALESPTSPNPLRPRGAERERKPVVSAHSARFVNGGGTYLGTAPPLCWIDA